MQPGRRDVQAAALDVGHHVLDHPARHYRDGAHVAELTGLLRAATLADYPPGTRILVRRERPHPDAQLDAFEHRDGWRYQCIATDTRTGQLAFPGRPRPRRRPHPLRQRTGLGRFPSRTFATNAAWLSAVMLAVDYTRCTTLPQPTH